LETITYSLKQGNKNSTEYYNEIKVITDEIFLATQKSLIPIADDFILYLQKYNLEEIREQEEYILELISFGVLWHTYAHKALSVKIAPFILLAKMSEWRKKHQKVKPLIDLMRGFCLTYFLLPEKTKMQHVGVPLLEQVDHVCKWFEATGEFREQALRFVRWRAFWETKDKQEIIKIFNTIEEFTHWFQDQTEKTLGKYTSKVDRFLEESHDKYRWREDRISCTRSRLEYHLNMVGAELMNRAFLREFTKTDRKVVLVPGCMRTHNDKNCMAKKVKEGLLCADCESVCRVNVLRKVGQKENFDVYVIPHASDLTLWAPKPGRPKRGVIASACVTTLVEGGWELKRYGIPAQCVLLDYSGCKKHWHCQGVPTALNVRELKNINSMENIH